MTKKFCEIDTCGQFHKTFYGSNICHYQCNNLSFDLGYAARGVTHIKKVYEIDTCGQFNKTFYGSNLHHYWCTALSFDLGHAAKGVNYDKKVL